MDPTPGIRPHGGAAAHGHQATLGSLRERFTSCKRALKPFPMN